MGNCPRAFGVGDRKNGILSTSRTLPPPHPSHLTRLESVNRPRRHFQATSSCDKFSIESLLLYEYRRVIAKHYNSLVIFRQLVAQIRHLVYRELLVSGRHALCRQKCRRKGFTDFSEIIGANARTGNFNGAPDFRRTRNPVGFLPRLISRSTDKLMDSGGLSDLVTKTCVYCRRRVDSSVCGAISRSHTASLDRSFDFPQARMRNSGGPA